MPCGAKCTALRERRVLSTTAGCVPPSPAGCRYLHMCNCGSRGMTSAGAIVAPAGAVCRQTCIGKCSQGRVCALAAARPAWPCCSSVMPPLHLCATTFPKRREAHGNSAQGGWLKCHDKFRMAPVRPQDWGHPSIAAGLRKAQRSSLKVHSASVDPVRCEAGVRALWPDATASSSACALKARLATGRPKLWLARQRPADTSHTLTSWSSDPLASRCGLAGWNRTCAPASTSFCLRVGGGGGGARA